MPVAKVVRLRVAAEAAAELDHALDHARQIFREESGTIHWDAYASIRPGERVLIEVFADPAATRRHDESPAVATLLTAFDQLGVDVLGVDLLEPPALPSEARATKEN